MFQISHFVSDDSLNVKSNRLFADGRFQQRAVEILIERNMPHSNCHSKTSLETQLGLCCSSLERRATLVGLVPKGAKARPAPTPPLPPHVTPG